MLLLAEEAMSMSKTDKELAPVKFKLIIHTPRKTFRCKDLAKKSF